MAIDVAADNKDRVGRNSTSARCRRPAARTASSGDSSCLRTFFQRMFAFRDQEFRGDQSALSSHDRASTVPVSSTTHLTAILASMTYSVTVRHALRAARFPTASAVCLRSVGAIPRQATRRKVRCPRQAPDEEFPDAPLRSNGRAGRHVVSICRSDRHRDHGHKDCRTLAHHLRMPCTIPN